MTTLRAALLLLALVAGCVPMGPREAPETDEYDAFAAVNAKRSGAPRPVSPLLSRPLLERLGGEAGVGAIIDELLSQLTTDPRVKARFDGASVVRLRPRLIQQLSALAGSGTPYGGRSMKEAHAGLAVTDAEFDAFVGDFFVALDRARVGEREKVELLTKITPMRKDVVGGAAVAPTKPAAPSMPAPVTSAPPPASAPATVPAAATATAAHAPVQAEPWTPEERRLAEKLIARFSQPSTVGDAAPTSELIGRRLEQTRFLAGDGDVLDLKDYEGRKRVVLVILRGFAGQVCLACTSQTYAVARAIDQFRQRNAEVVVVYPGAAETLPAFIEAVRNLKAGFVPPFPVVLDVDLAAVRLFKIEGTLAKPTTIILDESGVVRYAYVGKKPTDRPSAADLLGVLDRLGK